MDREIDNFAPIGEFFLWKPAAWLRVSGEDAFAFLQGQFTNDLRALGPTGAVYGLWLNHKGRVLADSFVLRGSGGEFWVGSYFCPASVIRARLESFIVADDVAVEDITADWSGVTLFGDSSAPGWSPGEAGAIGFAGRRSSASVQEWVFPSAAEPTIRSGFRGMRELSADDMEQRRIAAGIPAIPLDIGPGELPNEGGLDADAISYTKGCYLGQEVLARLKSMGQVRRRLRRIEGSGAWPALPAPLFQGGRKAGELRSAAALADGYVGLALITLLQMQGDQPLSFVPDAEAGGETPWANSNN